MDAQRPWARWAPSAGLVAVVLFGAWTRSSGFTSKDLWFDDAWGVLPSKVGLGTAVHMVNTTPLFTLLVRSWVQLHPGHAWWDQVPAFVLGLASIVAVYALLRYFAAWWPVALAGALVIAVSPVAATYSTRVKQFNGDILFACALLWCFERWRRDATRRRAIELGVLGALAMLFSATTAIVVVSVAAAAVLCGVVERLRRVDVAWLLGIVGVAGVVEYVVWLRHLSHSLYAGWTARGYILSVRSLHRVAYSFQAMGTGVLHWMLGVPTGHPPYPSATVTAAGLAIAALVAVGLVAIVAPPLVRCARPLRELPGALVAPALCVALAVLLAVVGVSPFGGGRTDEVLYPSLLVLVVGAVAGVRKPSAERAPARSRAVLAGVVVVAVACVAVGVTNRATYPVTSVANAYAKLRPHVRAGDLIVVDPWVTFTWADDGVTASAISLHSSFFPWSQGFHVVSRDPRVIISTNYFFPDAQYARLAQRTDRIWYVGEGDWKTGG